MTEEELIKLYDKGVLVQDIADRAGTTRGTINNKLCALRKAKKIGRRPQNASEERQEIARKRAELVEEFRNRGLTNEEIADKLGISMPRVWQIVQQLIKSRRIDAMDQSLRIGRTATVHVGSSARFTPVRLLADFESPPAFEIRDHFCVARCPDAYCGLLVNTRDRTSPDERPK